MTSKSLAAAGFFCANALLATMLGADREAKVLPVWQLG